MKVPSKDRETIESFGAEIVSVENRVDQKGVLAYNVYYDGQIYRWAISSLQRRVPPWSYTKKPQRKYTHGNKNFIYRMFDEADNLLYIGKTSQLDYRLYAHFYKNPEPWEDTVVRMDVCEFANEADMHVYEMYLVTKHSPVFNRDAKCPSAPSFELPDIVFVELSDWK